MKQTLKASLEMCVLGLSLGLVVFFVGCGSDTATPPVCSTFECRSTKFNLETAKYNLVTANLDGSDLVVVAKDTYREMTHPRITFDRTWIAYTRHNQLNPNGNGCAEVKQDTSTAKYNYANTEIRATNMDGSVQIPLTTPNTTRLSTNSYWIDNTYNFTFLEGPVVATPTDKIQIKRGYRNVNMFETAVVSAVSVPDTIFVVDPQQVGSKIVFPGLYLHPTLNYLVLSIFTLDLLSSSAVPVGRTIATVYMGLPASAVNVAQVKANENDPKLSPNGSQIAFMRRIDTTNPLYNHGFHIFVTSASGVPGTEIDISDKYLGANKQSLFYNDGVPEWIDETTLVFFTLNFTNPSAPPDYGLEQKLYTMKINPPLLRTEIPLPTGYYYSDPIPYKDALGNTRILFAANKTSTACTQ